MIDREWMLGLMDADDLVDQLVGVPDYIFEPFDLISRDHIVGALRDDPANETARMFAAKAVFQHVHVAELWAAGNHGPAMNMLGSNSRLPYLIVHADTLDAATLGPLLMRAWIEPNLTLGGPLFDYDAAVALFDRACGGGVVLTDDETTRDRVLAERPVLFRGDDPMHRQDAEPWDGVSWTWDRAVAERFASAASGRIWSIDFPANAVPYAVVTQRNEREVLLDPSRWPAEPVELAPVPANPGTGLSIIDMLTKHGRAGQ